VYDEAKRFAEAMTMAYHRYHGIDTRIVRIFNTYGPRMRARDGRVVSNLVVQALRGEPLTIYGDGSQSRSFCYVSDLIDGIYRLFISSRRVDPTNIGNPIEFMVLQLARLVKEMTGSSAEIIHRPARRRSQGPPAGYLGGQAGVVLGPAIPLRKPRQDHRYFRTI
jgi:dTDP-glucose 4,6-dehydratase